MIDIVTPPQAPPRTAAMPVGAVLVHPEDNPRVPGSRRIIKIATTHGDWPWRRLTGRASGLPAADDDLKAWKPQPLADLAHVLGHPREGS